MPLQSLVFEQRVTAGLRDVFDYFATPLNLDATTPDSLRIRVLSPPPYEMATGSVFEYAMRLRGLPIRWTSRITRFEPPHRFTYIQLRGPYAFWEHDHRYAETERVTTIRDEVRYALPLGPIGRVANRLFVRRELDHIFRQRSRLIARHFAADCSESGAGSSASVEGGRDVITTSGGRVSP